MNNLTNDLPKTVTPVGKWKNVFSYRPFDIEIIKAEGIYLYDDQGHRYIDASGGALGRNLGHNDPRINDAITSQLEKYAYSSMMTACGPRADLCNRIADIAPGNLNASYLVSGGSEAVETAVKIARHAQLNRGFDQKYKVISNHEAYHGMTFGALALSGLPGSQAQYDPYLMKFPKIHQYSDFRKPDGMDRDEWGVQCALELEEAIHYAGAHSVAAYLATPHGAGADYAVVPPKIYWKTIREICDRYDVFLIADEVVTGFGRTGSWFAMEHFDVVPDMMVTAKGISSLNLPLAAVTVSDEINEPFLNGESLIHGFTGGGNVLSCVTASAVIDIIKEDNLLEHTRAMSEVLFGYREKLLSHPTVKDIRGWGLIMIAELVKNKETMAFFDSDEKAEQRLNSVAIKNGIISYSSLYGSSRQPSFRRGIPLYIVPPIVINTEQINDMMDRLDRTLTEWEQSLGL